MQTGRIVTVEALGGPLDGEWVPLAEAVVVLEWGADGYGLRHAYKLETDDTGRWLRYAGSFTRELVGV